MPDHHDKTAGNSTSPPGGSSPWAPEARTARPPATNPSLIASSAGRFPPPDPTYLPPPATNSARFARIRSKFDRHRPANSLRPNRPNLWSGPHGERHDFVGTGVHVEVKTTTRSKNEHEISRLDQLRAPQGKRLLLVSVLLERSMEGDKTLADLIDDITGKLGNNGAAIDTFEAGIKKLGWHEGLRQTGALLRFNLREAHVFEVEGAFPRLPDDYHPPRGVIAIRYTIDVAALPTMSRAAVEVILKAM